MEVVAKVTDDNKMCFGKALKPLRDARENKIIMFPSMRVISPVKDVYCISIDGDKVAVKVYNKSIYTVYNLANKDVFKTKSMEELKKKLRETLSEQEIERLLKWIEAL